METDTLTLQLADSTDITSGEQLKTAGMHTGEHNDRRAAVNHQDAAQEGNAEIKLTANYRLVLPLRDGLDVADISKTFGLQQFLGGKERRDADAAIVDDAHAGRFQLFARTERPFCADKSEPASE